jgi:hypothetical protein
VAFNNALITDEDRWYLLNSKMFESKIAAAFVLFREHGLDPVLIKGWAAAQYYPDDKPRPYVDIDLAVAAADFDKAAEVLRTPTGSKFGVDLHRELRHLDPLSWEELIRNSNLIDVDGVPIRVLSCEDHLRVLCVHWLTDGGESKERLWDIYYAVQNRPEGFDWGKCLDVVTQNRRRWVVCTIGLAHRYLDLKLDGIPFADEARTIPEWLTGALEQQWRSGVRIRGLETCLKDPKAFFQQLRKRFPPSPITATVEMNGSFDGRTRIFYQIGDIFHRSLPSLRRVRLEILRKN